jgi:hypothetical protein
MTISFKEILIQLTAACAQAAGGFSGFGWTAGTVGDARFSDLFLNSSDDFLRFAFNALAGVARDLAGDVVQIPLGLFDFPGSDVFTSHDAQLL